MTPDAPDAAAIERGRRLFAGPCVFVAGAATPASLPAGNRPEVAFAGRSNVGKSSLLNALTGRKTLARVSHTPGRTQQINFFDLDDRLDLVDLPGYGYAQASKQRIAAWTGLVDDYLRGRVNLRRVCLLIDCRHGLKDADRRALDLLDEAAVVYQAVLTKADKLTPEAAAAARRSLAAALARRTAAHPRILVTSSATGFGIPELRAELAALAAQD